MTIMSDRVAAISLDAPALRLTALGGGSGQFARDSRFGAGSATPAPLSEPGDIDPLEQAFALGYTQGAQDTERAASAAKADEDAARSRIEMALGHLDAEHLHEFELRLRQTVLTLCEAVIGSIAVDPAALTARIGIAAAMLSRAADERIIRLHPEDLALVSACLPDDWHFEPDPALERGALRVEGAAGGVEDGPALWRAALEEALAQC
jgi:flagellar assembly protein FliH